MISSSDEVRDLVAGGFSVAKDLIGRGSEFLAGALGTSGDDARLRPVGLGAAMRFVDEYRDPSAARALVARITELAGRP